MGATFCSSLEREVVIIPCSTSIGLREWIVAFLARLVYTALTNRTRNLFTAVVAHSVTNAFLAIYILFSGKFQYW